MATKKKAVAPVKKRKGIKIVVVDRTHAVDWDDFSRSDYDEDSLFEYFELVLDELPPAEPVYFHPVTVKKF